MVDGVKPAELHRRVVAIIDAHDDRYEARTVANAVVLTHACEGATPEVLGLLAKLAEGSPTGAGKRAWQELAEALLRS
jgi:hypothetical protein